MSAKGSSIAKAAIGATIIVICIVAFWRDTHFSFRDVVHYGKGPKTPYMERWQAEAIYLVCTVAGATLLTMAIHEMTNK